MKCFALNGGGFKAAIGAMGLLLAALGESGKDVGELLHRVHVLSTVSAGSWLMHGLFASSNLHALLMAMRDAPGPEAAAALFREQWIAPLRASLAVEGGPDADEHWLFRKYSELVVGTDAAAVLDRMTRMSWSKLHLIGVRAFLGGEAPPVKWSEAGRPIWCINCAIPTDPQDLLRLPHARTVRAQVIGSAKAFEPFVIEVCPDETVRRSALPALAGLAVRYSENGDAVGGDRSLAALGEAQVMGTGELQMWAVASSYQGSCVGIPNAQAVLNSMYWPLGKTGQCAVEAIFEQADTVNVCLGTQTEEPFEEHRRRSEPLRKERRPTPQAVRAYYDALPLSVVDGCFHDNSGVLTALDRPEVTHVVSVCTCMDTISALLTALGADPSVADFILSHAEGEYGTERLMCSKRLYAGRHDVGIDASGRRIVPWSSGDILQRVAVYRLKGSILGDRRITMFHIEPNHAVWSGGLAQKSRACLSGNLDDFHWYMERLLRLAASCTAFGSDVVAALLSD